jgi:hypothetical protein
MAKKHYSVILYSIRDVQEKKNSKSTNFDDPPCAVFLVSLIIFPS